ncbi:MAG: YfhO family protein [Actinobacteria bacterium]|uniref:Unannotated protein n=1 Tax=freshwater metagenome TaxID=449393 RepID=A0A6J7NDC3_9ZZZZ|nr:YfhO family protein [Actinomycetota bacterium]MSX79425.1 YfhO family protein [Actinomycetota bacterium]
MLVMTRQHEEWIRRHRIVLGLSATLLFVTLPFLEVVIGAKTAMFGDINAAHLPRYSAVWDSIRNGNSPFWSGRILGGYNVLGAGQSAVFYPPNFLFDTFSPAVAYRFWMLLHLWLLAGGFFAWSWHRWHSVLAATTTGIAGTLNGFVIYHLIHMPFTAALAWVPWVMLTLDLVLERRGKQRMVALALLIACLSVTGHPQMLWLTLVAVGVTTLVRLARRKPDTRAASRVAGAVLLGLGLSAVQLIPQTQFAQSSVRSDATRAYVLDHSAAPRHLLTLVAPNILGGADAGPAWSADWTDSEIQHEVANYLGIALAMFAVIAAIRHWRDRRVIALLVAAAIGLLMAVAGQSPIGHLLYRVVPFASNFRAWSRHIVLVNIAVAMLAGLGLREVARTPRRWFVPTLVGSAVFAAVLIPTSLVPGVRRQFLSGGEGVAARVIPLAFLLVIPLVLGFRRKGGTLTGALLVGLCTLDVTMFTVSAPWRNDALSRSEVEWVYGSSVPLIGTPFDAAGGVDRWVNDSSTIWELMLPNRAPAATGYDPLLQKDFARVFGSLNEGGFPLTQEIWSGTWLPDVLRVTTFYGRRAVPSSSRWTQFGRPTAGFRQWSYTPRLPETYLVGSVRLGSLANARERLLDRTTPLTGLAYVDTSTVRNDEVGLFGGLNTSGLSGTVDGGSMDEGGQGRWAVTAERASLFVTSYAWMEGWTAKVDGRAVPVARTNGLVLGVPVPAGQHEVSLSFTPKGWVAGRNLSLAAATALTLMLLSGTTLVRRWTGWITKRARGTRSTTC